MIAPTLSTQRQQLITEALSWVGTPYHHRAMVKGVGADCVGLPAGVALACGLLPCGWQLPYYSTQWHLHQNESLLKSTLEALGAQHILLSAAQPGDLLLFFYGRTVAHTAILVSEGYVVHAVLDEQVHFHRLAGDLASRLRLAYRFPGISEDVA